MNDQKFKSEIRSRFEEDVPDVLSKIKSSPDFMVPQKPSIRFNFRNLFVRRISLSLASIFIVAITIFAIGRSTADPVVASTITIDVNPSIEITLDEDDFVISVTALNNDGIEIVSRDIKYQGMTIDEVLESLVERLANNGYIITSDEDNIVLIEVSSLNLTIQERVENAFKNKLTSELNKYGNSNYVLNARNIKITETQKQKMLEDNVLSNLTTAKLTLIYRIQELDNSYTLQYLATLNIRQLYVLFIDIESPDNFEDYGDMPGNRNNDNSPGNNNSSLPDNPDSI